MANKNRTLRIIGGLWRRRLLKFPDISELRPTHDFIRETLFNWLTPFIQGATCLDLFAGSGALGFEALSRGAERVTLVDRNSIVINFLKKTVQTLKISSKNIQIIQGDCFKQCPPFSFYPCDIVFLDPPFYSKQLSSFAIWLESSIYLAKSALIYVEMEKQKKTIQLANWHCLREGHTAHVSYYLFQRVTNVNSV